MKYHLMILLVFVVVAHFQENHGYKTGCECPDFPFLLSADEDEKYFYEKHDGCSFNFTCPEGTTGALFCKFSEPEIPTSPNSYYGTLDIIANPYYGPLIPPYDIYSTFGLICENGSWYVTKYPAGVQYYYASSDYATMGSAEEYAGKKSRVDEALCFSPF